MPLFLKAISPADYGAYHALINDPLVSYNSSSVPHPVDQAFATQRLLDRAANERILGGIVQRGAYVDGTLVGDASLFTNEAGELEIGYCVAEAHRGKGYASEMARQLVKLARDHGHSGPMSAGYAKDNPVSGKILEKLGFTQVGETMESSVGREGLSPYIKLALPAAGELTAPVTTRPLEHDDIAAVYALQHDPKGAAMAGVEGEFVAEDVFKENMKALIGKGEEAAFIFAIMAAGEMAGYIVCLQGPSGKWQVSYWLDQRFWGRGIATAAFRQLLERLPANILNQHLYAAVIDSNAASVRLLEKFGFTAFKQRDFLSAAHGEMKRQTLFRR